MINSKESNMVEAQSGILKKNTSGITMKDKIGYALGDGAGTLLFGLVGPFIQMFYTDTLLINASSVMVLFLIARLWDGINDPIWGVYIDSRKPSKHGKYRQYLKWFSIPLAISGLLLFTKIPGLTPTQYLIYAYITYILYDMMYTTVNIPYGSLASVITSDENERAELSAFRSVGSILGGLPASIILPFLVYSALSTSEKILDSKKLFLCVAVLSVISLIIYRVSFNMIKERVPSPEKPPKTDVFGTMIALVKNRAFISLCIASILLIASQIYTQTIYNYLFKNYFEKPGLYSLVMMATYGPTVLLLPFMGKLVKRFGKKELCGVGALIAMVSNFILWILKVNNPYMFLIFCFISGFGITFFAMEVWAMVTDTIDEHERRTRRREESTCFSFFCFTRKLGQTLAGLFSTYTLVLINYDPVQITEKANNDMYSIATLLPAIMYFLIFAVLIFIYPISKKKLQELHTVKEQISA